MMWTLYNIDGIYGMLPESYITYEIYKACYRNYQTSQDVAHNICYMHTLWGSSCLKLQPSCITLLNQNAGTDDLKRHLLLFNYVTKEKSPNFKHFYPLTHNYYLSLYELFFISWCRSSITLLIETTSHKTLLYTIFIKLFIRTTKPCKAHSSRTHDFARCRPSKLVLI